MVAMRNAGGSQTWVNNMETVEFTGFLPKKFEKKGIMKFLIHGGMNFLYVIFFKMSAVKKSGGLGPLWCYNCLTKTEPRAAGTLLQRKGME